MHRPIMPRNPIDENVGMQIRHRRNVLGISESLLAEALGLTLSEYQKCENGERRVGAEGLLKLAALLCVSPSFFFEGSPVNVEISKVRGGPTLQ
jgi:transcriptional regulator with XRE-family HTH domain